MHMHVGTHANTRDAYYISFSNVYAAMQLYKFSFSTHLRMRLVSL